MKFVSFFVIGTSFIAGMLLEQLEQIFIKKFTDSDTEWWHKDIIVNRELINATLQQQMRYNLFY